MKKSLVIEGWRGLAHSFSVVNQFQCLELLKDNRLSLYHRDVPYFRSEWKPEPDLLGKERAARLSNIPDPPGEMNADAIYRIAFPFDFSPFNASRLVVFTVHNFGVVETGNIHGASWPSGCLKDPRVRIVTPSQWSKQALLRSRINPDRVHVVPHGVDTEIFKPLPETDCNGPRSRFGMEGSFVFLNVGAVTPNKGIGLLLKSFSSLLERFPEAMLVLKGSDALYPSQNFLKSALSQLSQSEQARLIPRLKYIGKNLSFPEMAKLYQVCDAYVSPYYGEGFNMPVLEAIASGLPVLCTRGGPTDDFTNDDFALQISSRLEETTLGGGQKGLILMPDGNHLLELMAQTITDGAFRRRARQTGPEWAARKFTWAHAVESLLEVTPIGSER